MNLRDKLKGLTRPVPEAFADQLKRTVLQHVLTGVAIEAYEWLTAKPWRKIVVENQGSEGISIAFTENDDEVEPEFMKR